MLNLSNLKRQKGSKKKFKRVGRGHASGMGKTCGRGHKGQKSRSGGGVRPGFEGGQTPLYRRLPKQHKFKNLLFKQDYEIIKLELLNEFNDGEELKYAVLKDKFLKGRDRLLKILGNGELTKKLTVEAHKFSESAKAKIEKMGGKAVQI